MKKSKLLIALLMVSVMILSLCLFVSCNKDSAEETTTEEETVEIEATEGLLITNGDFKVVDTDSETYPLSVDDWTGASQYSSGSFNTDVIAGVISLDSALYEANKSEWKDDDKTIYNLLTADGRYGDADEIKNALMIYMPEEETDDDDNTIYGPTAYGYTSSSFTLEKASYYKLSVDVLTYNIGGTSSNTEADRGARIYVSSNTYAEFAEIKTDGLWKTYTVYVETDPSSSTSLTLMLGLGKYASDFTTGLTTGYAFFDNVELTKIEENAETTYAQAKTDELDSTKDNVATATLKVPNGRFDFGTTSISSSATPSNWSVVTGNSSEDDSAPTSLGYNGIIDLSKFADNYSSYSTSYTIKDKDDESLTAKPATYLETIVDSIQNQGTGIVGTNAYMLSQQLMTAQGIKSSKTITIEKNKVYALSIKLYTYDIHGAGVSLILSGSDSDDIVISGISANKSENLFIGRNIIDANSKQQSSLEGKSTAGWATYTFYLKANQYKDFSYNMTVWLGTEGTNSNTSVSYYSYTSSSDSVSYTANGTFSNGWVFVDELTLTEIEETSIPSGVYDTDKKLDCAKNLDKTAIKVDLSSANLLDKGNLLTEANATANTSTKVGVTNATTLGTPTDWISEYDTTENTNPIISGNIITDGLVKIDSEENFTTSGGKGTYPDMPYDIETKNAYMIYAAKDSYYEVESNAISLDANKFYRLSFWVKTVDIKSTSSASVALINDDSAVSTFSSINTDDYDDYTNDWCEYTFIIRVGTDNVNVSLKFMLGSGTRWDTDTLTSGALFVANMDLEKITYSTFSGTTTGTYINSYDLSTSTSYTFTNGGFDDYDLDDENLEDSKALKEQGYAATPEDWTISDDTLDANVKDGENKFDLVAGIIALNTKDADKMEYEGSTQTLAVLPDYSFADFYGIDSGNKYTAENISKVGGPNLLVISSKTTKNAVGFASESKSLSSSSFYKISVWAKAASGTNASIYLTSDSSVDTSSQNYFLISGSNVWTQYTFYIKVGITSTSVKMNLWLGYDTDYVEVENEGDEKSTGTVFFDNVTYFSISEDDYTAAASNTNIQKLAYTTETFDSFSVSTSTRSSLSTPSNWTGEEDTDQDEDNTISGVAYCDDSYYTTKDSKYVDYFGLEYSEDDITVTDTDEDYIAAAADPANEGKDIVSIVKAARIEKLKEANWLPISKLTAYSGKSCLAINNTEKSAYKYTSTSITMEAESYYCVSIMIKTYAIDTTDETAGAYIELYLGDAADDDNPLIFKAKTADDWTKYTFYVETLEDEVSSITLKASLGKYILDEDTDEVTGLTTGYLFIDDFSVEKVDVDFDEIEEEIEAGTLVNTLARTVSIEEEGEADDEDEEESETESSSFNLEYLWWMIPTIILGVLIIAVVIVWIVKKIVKPYKKRKEKEGKVEAEHEDSFVTPQTLDEKHDKYDENKE